MYLSPIFVDQSTTFDRIACRADTGFSGSSTVRLGIYNSDADNQPSTLVLDAGTVAFTGVASQEITISQTLSTGLYWLAFCQQGTAPTTATYTGNSGSATIFNYLIPFSGSGSLNANNIIAYTSNPHTGAFPSTTSFGVAAATAFVWLRTA
jgi:hypothetical protein